MSVLIHDGSLPGFLCAVAEFLNLSQRGAPLPALRSSRVAAELFEEELLVARDDGRAAKLWKRLGERIGDELQRKLLLAFCSDMAGADGAIALLTARLWREGPIAMDDLASPEVLLVEKASRRTGCEAHRFMGLVRFSELSDGTWYSPIEPDCDVLPFMAAHFASRLSSMNWVIHDTGRGSALLHVPGRSWRLVEQFSLNRGGLPLSAREEELRECWREYFDSIAIGERKNPRCQRNFMPKKHWKNLTEMGNGPR